MMKCPNCGHINEGGKFCENCGTQLIEKTENTVQQSNPQLNNGGAGTVQTEDYLKKTKDQSKQYITYFIDVLKKPYASLHAPLENQHFTHAIITFILYSLFIPLMLYFGVRGVMNTFSEFGASDNMSPTFMDAVIIPTIAYAIFMVLVAGFTFISIKLGRVNVTFKEVFTRFGVLLVPFVFILAIGVILSILEVSLFILFLVIGLIGSIYIVVPALISFYKKGSSEGMDVIYGTMLTYILTFVLLVIMGEMLIDSIISSIDSFFFGF